MNRIIAFAICLILHPLAFSQTIDLAFAPRILSASSSANVVGVQADNKLLVSSAINGYVDNEPIGFFSRLHENGELDTTFHYPTELGNSPGRVAVLTDGRIIIAGSFTSKNGTFLGNVLRLNPDGSLDNTFSPFVLDKFSVGRLKLLPNRKIFISGFSPRPDGTSGVVYQALVLLPNGVPDLGFPTLRFATAPNSNVSLDDIGFQSSNELILAGSDLKIGNRTQKIYRIDSLGNVDTSYNPIFTSTFSFNIRNIALLADGTLGVLASNFSSVTIFDRNGKRIFAESLQNDYAFMHPVGKSKFAVLGKSNYEIEPKINTYSKREDIGFNDYIYNAVSQGEDRIVVAGRFSQIGNNFKAGIARIRAGEQIFTTYDNAFSIGFYTPGSISDAFQQSDGKILIAGFFHLVNGSRINHLARLMPNGELDPSFGSNLANIKRGINKIRQQSNGNIVIGSRKTPDFDGQLNGLNIVAKDGNFIRTLSYPYFGGITDISYLAVDGNDRIYAGENVAYSFGNGDSGQTLVRFSANGTREANYNDLYINSLVRYNGLLVQPDQKLLIFGQSLRYDNSDSTVIVRALPNGLRDSDFKVDFDKKAYGSSAVLLPSKEIIIGGYIRDSKNVNRPFLLKVDSLGKSVASFEANLGSNPDRPSIVTLITKLPHDQIMVSGSFDQYNGRAVNKNIILDHNGKFIANFFPNFENPRFTTVINLDKGHYLLGGSFISPNGAVSLIKVSPVSTSVNEIPKQQMAKKSRIFPNPTFTEILQVEIPLSLENKVQFQICELATGKVLSASTFAPQPQTLHSIDLKGLINGNYVLHLQGNGWSESHVFSKIR